MVKVKVCRFPKGKTAEMLQIPEAVAVVSRPGDHVADSPVVAGIRQWVLRPQQSTKTAGTKAMSHAAGHRQRHG